MEQLGILLQPTSPYTCDDCGTVCSTNKALKQHCRLNCAAKDSNMFDGYCVICQEVIHKVGSILQSIVLNYVQYVLEHSIT